MKTVQLLMIAITVNMLFALLLPPQGNQQTVSEIYNESFVTQLTRIDQNSAKAIVEERKETNIIETAINTAGSILESAVNVTIFVAKFAWLIFDQILSRAGNLTGTGSQIEKFIGFIVLIFQATINMMLAIRFWDKIIGKVPE